MYAYLQGLIVEKNMDNLILEVNQIGYEIQFDSQTAGRFPKQGEEAKVWVYMHVHDDNYSLFGFVTAEEKKLFEMLRTVNGIGPKTAIQIVGALSPESFAMAVLNEDLKILTTIKGIGKKTAQRMILELKDKLNNSTYQADQADSLNLLKPDDNSTGKGIIVEAIEALLLLGYTSNVAERAVTQAAKSLNNSDTPMELENLIRTALRGQAKI